MSRELRISADLARVLDELSDAEVEEVREILDALEDTDDLSELTDYIEPRPPLIYHVTLGEHVAISWRETANGIAVSKFDRYRPPPADLP